MSESIPISGPGGPAAYSQALWQWTDLDTYPVATGYGVGKVAPTKSGLMPQDLQDFVGVPLQYYQPQPTPVNPARIIDWIRQAEDEIEQMTGLLLCPTWIASPPALQYGQTQNTQIETSSGSQIQLLGQDYDLADAAYDFMFPRAQDSGWMAQSLRYKPVRNVTQPSRILDTKDFNGVKNFSMIYPLLSQFFRAPPTWIVEDQDFGMIRLVPSQNIQMLPLFQLQLAFLGFAESLPGGLWLNYTAGLTASDYNSRFRFIKQLVLSLAAVQALSSIQGSVSMGVVKHSTLVDGVQFSAEYDKAGAFAGLITQFQKQADNLMDIATSRVAGPSFITI